MAKIERFEDIEAWQKARELASVVYGVSNQGPFSREMTTETGNLIGGFMRYLTNHVGDRATRNPQPGVVT